MSVTLSLSQFAQHGGVKAIKEVILDTEELSLNVSEMERRTHTGFYMGGGAGTPLERPPPPPQNFHTHTKFESMWHLGAPDAASEHLNFLGGGGGVMPLGVVTPHAAFFPPSAKISLHLDRLQDKIWVGKACTLI